MERENKNQSDEDKLIINEGLDETSPLNKLPTPSILKSSKSICKIGTPSQISSGFFIKFFKGEKDFYCLMTNEHIITRKLIKEKRTINVYCDYESTVKEINLNPEERFIKEFNTELNIDATVVEILPKNNIGKDNFLLPSLEYMSLFNNLTTKEITIIQYPLGQMSYSNGIIKEINHNLFAHNASTQSGSSGSPIIIKDSIRVIGIHKGSSTDNSKNYGDFIEQIFNYFKNGLKYKIIFENGDYCIGGLKKNKKNGKGKKYNNKGELIFEGEYLNGKRNGKGKKYYEGELEFEGEYLNGKRNGKGKEYYGGELIFEGEYINEEKMVKEKNTMSIQL